ncbi:MAG: hypothetical protein ACM3VS_18845 [Candidatus Dadabacteria bacterium]
MKNLSILLATVFLLLGPFLSNACKISLNIERESKSVYKPGEIAIVKITVVMEHRNCDVSIDNTDINVSGSQIIGATKWVNTDGKTWERKIKIKILSDPHKQALIVAERTCHKDGGKGVLKLQTT